MLEGSLWDKILVVALPFAFTGIMQQLFNAADIAMLGQFVGKEAMAAVGSNSPIIGMVLSLFIGISLGANVIIARFIGKKNIHGVHAAVHTAILVALGCGVAMAIAGELLVEPLLRLLSVPEEIFDLAVLYLRVFWLAMPFILLYNFESSIFRSQGDTRTPLYCLIASGITKFFLNLFFILVLDMSVEGVAIGTIIATALSSAMLFYFLCRSQTEIRVRLTEFHVDKRILLPMLRIGLPAGMQGMVFALSNLCIQSAINELGPDVMAASAAAFNLEIFTFFLINASSVGQSMFRMRYRTQVADVSLATAAISGASSAASWPPQQQCSWAGEAPASGDDGQAAGDAAFSARGASAAASRQQAQEERTSAITYSRGYGLRHVRRGRVDDISPCCMAYLPTGEAPAVHPASRTQRGQRLSGRRYVKPTPSSW